MTPLLRIAAITCAALALLLPVAKAAPKVAAAPALPVIYSYNVSGTLTMNLGETKTFTWTVGGATSVSLSGVGPVTGTSVDVSPTATTTYTLTATNAAGSVSQSKTITVTVPPVISSFAASPASIAAGAPTTLSWVAKGATSYSVQADVGTSPGNTTASSVTAKPAQTTTYTLTARNSAGTATATTSVSVTAAIPKPVIDSFTTSSASIITGSSVTLTWATENATSVSISPTLGVVTGTSATVSPTQTTSYTLSATNSSGTVTKKLSVTVSLTAPPPVISSFSASPNSISAGGTSVLMWSVSGATSVSISPSIGTVTGSSFSVTPGSTTSYVLTATNSVGTVTKNVTVSIAAPAVPTITIFAATPAFIESGSSSVLSWTVANSTSISIAADIGTSPGVVSGTSFTVSPTQTTNYTLTATNAVGSSTSTFPVVLFTAQTGSSVSHPRIWVTPTTANTLNTRAAVNDPAWLKLRSDCDQYVTMAIEFPDQDPASNTINGGYEFNDYLLPSEELALGYVAAKTADPARAAKYATKERQLLLALSDPVHHGRPTTDDGYSIRSYVPALALGYDWIYDTLSDADRAQIYTEINRWVTSFDQQGFGRDFPQGNYFAGYYCAKALGALATEGDNPSAAAMWSDWLNRLHYGMVQPYYASYLSGGGAPDGWNYGPFETINMARPIAAALTAKGLDLIHDPRPFPYLDGHARWITQFTWPDLSTVSDRGFVYDSDNPTATDPVWATQFNGLLHLANGDNAALMQRYTLDLRAKEGTSDVEPWAEFLMTDATAPAANYRTALSYQTNGDGQVAMRSDWTTTAVWAAFQAGPYTGFTDSSEEFFDEGGLTIQRGNVQLLVNAWGALMRDTPGTDDASTGDVFDSVYNELFSDQTDGVHAGRRLFNTYYAVRTGGYWGQIGNGPDDSNTTLDKFEEGGSYVLMRGIHMESQYLDGHPITAWSREVAYVRPQLFFAYDRTSLNSASVDNWMAWHVEAAPTEIAGAAAGTHSFDVVDTRAAFGGNLYRGRVSTLLPAGNTVSNVNLFNLGKVFRMEVRQGTPSASATWLTVLDASASQAAAGSATPISAAAGNVQSGAVEGGLVSLPTGNDVAVLFSKTGSAVAGTVAITVPDLPTYCLVNDLAPGAGYTVIAAANNGTLSIQLTPGGTLTTTAHGTLSLSVSASGVISLQ